MSNKKRIKRKKLAYQGICMQCENIFLVGLIIKNGELFLEFTFGCNCYLDVNFSLFEKEDFNEFFKNNCSDVVVNKWT